ncbi:hypothetical protein PCANC_09373 [Puccinia coronata f. sp. avenae]|uniref:Thioredoxin domain-containing protein n=1 Tax=Puccinia coronata f. sp. avenae TaxID=200324 RepID=A0A2N5VDB5_9BASI|nr:hypothetical protein PCANC_09373 [Puccinia coronata f. sp. avenae]
MVVLAALLSLLVRGVMGVQLHAGDQLNENSFDSSIQHGLWFIECYSPFCPHCKHFAPTWIELVDKMKPRQLDGLNMGQVDCIAQGDLCIRLDVDYYPQMKLYEDGKFIESYNGDKKVEAIAAYLEQKTEAYRSTHHQQQQQQQYTDPAAPATPAPVQGTPSSADDGKTHSASSTPPDTTHTTTEQPGAHPHQTLEHPSVSPKKPTTTATPTGPASTHNPTGSVVTLDKHNWHAYTNPPSNPLPIFIQFQTAWCKECRTLAPVWDQVAHLLAKDGNVAVLDCEAPENADICRAEHAVQFPSFVMYHDGTKVAYSGPKEASSMVEFARKTIATPGSLEISVREFEDTLQKKRVFFLLLHSSRTPLWIIKAVETVGKGFQGSAVILKSDSQTLYDRQELSNMKAYMLVFKESEPRAWAKLELEEDAGTGTGTVGAGERQQKLGTAIRHWMSVHSIGIQAELGPHNLHRLFNSGARKLVVLSCLSGIVTSTASNNRTSSVPAVDHSNPKALLLRDEIRLWARQWRLSQIARAVDIPIDWVWVNSEVWAEWLYDSYGITLPPPSAEDPTKSSSIIIVDPQHHVFYLRQENGRPIAFLPASVFQTLLAIEMNKLQGSLQGSLASRIAWRVQRLKHSLRMVTEPQWILFWMVVVGVAGWWYKRRAGRSGGGYGGLSSSMPATASSSSSDPKPAFATVFGLASNVPLKAD